MSGKFLLYIDVLGFSDLTTDERRVRELYCVIDSLSAHRHGAFSTIVFSDTILIYNKDGGESDRDRKYFVWYAIEFAEDLLSKLAGTGIFFRALLTYGEFDHYSLQNIQCFFGEALVRAYKLEKAIPAVGLFIDEYCNQFNEFFQTDVFADDLRFVFLCRSLERLHEVSEGHLPVDRMLIDDCDEFPYIMRDLCFLREVSTAMQSHPSPLVRAKHLATWDFYHRRYAKILDMLRLDGFRPERICPRADWQEHQKRLSEPIKAIFGL